MTPSAADELHLGLANAALPGTAFVADSRWAFDLRRDAASLRRAVGSGSSS